MSKIGINKRIKKFSVFFENILNVNFAFMFKFFKSDINKIKLKN